MTDDYRTKIGKLISELRVNHGLTQAQLAAELGTSQSAINRIERGAQNVSLEIIARISDVLNSEIISLSSSSKLNLRIHGGSRLGGEITVNTSKNAGVGLLCASLLNQGKTTLRHVARIEEVNRIIEAMLPYGVFAMEKAILTELGIPMGNCRKPFLPLSEEGKKVAGEIAAKLK